MSLRIGQGWDRHPLVEGRPCILGGVHFSECPRGPSGHSDGDVVCHAVIDAVLGAAGKGDIGGLFPDTDPQWEGADSMELLASTWAPLVDSGFRLVNLDVIAICEQPPIGPRAEAMASGLAKILGVARDRVNIKATRGEGLGPEGRGECVTVQAVVLLEKT